MNSKHVQQAPKSCAQEQQLVLDMPGDTRSESGTSIYPVLKLV